jgi:hypothetical protein
MLRNGIVMKKTELTACEPTSEFQFSVALTSDPAASQNVLHSSLHRSDKLRRF